MFYAQQSVLYFHKSLVKFLRVSRKAHRFTSKNVSNLPKCFDRGQPALIRPASPLRAAIVSAVRVKLSCVYPMFFFYFILDVELWSRNYGN